MSAIHPLGEEGWTVVLGEQVDRGLAARARRLAERVREASLPGVLEVVPAYAAVTVFFDPGSGDAGAIREALERLATGPAPLDPGSSPDSSRPPIVIPVRYDGPDLAEVATRTGLTRDEVVRRHAAPIYEVYLLGFAPGFGYLGDLDPALVLPRRSTPRTRIPAGSVAIAGAQTAVYPLETPGGWNLIGRTETVMFDPARTPPALLAPGDRVRFEVVA